MAKKLYCEQTKTEEGWLLMVVDEDETNVGD
jgi:hypothetical protein